MSETTQSVAPAPGWLDPPNKPPHVCADLQPSGVTAWDAGRRWLCSCDKVYVVAVLGPGREQGELYFKHDPCSLVGAAGVNGEPDGPTWCTKHDHERAS